LKYFTQDYDNIVNDILALDRGEYRPANNYDTHKYIIKHLVSRMKQSDFQYLPDQVKQMYMKKLQEHEQIEGEQMKQIQAAKDGFIPTSGYLVTCDFYVPDPESPGKPKRARVPYESLKWLIERIETQGTKMDELEGLQQGALYDMAKKMLGAQLPQGGQPAIAAPEAEAAPVGQVV